MPIRTIIFDLGRVIVPFDFDRAYARVTALTGLDRQEIRRRLTASGIVPRLESGRIEPAPFVAEFCRIIGHELSYGEFSDIWFSIFDPHTLIPESLLETLKVQYRLLLLSNTNAIHYEMVEERYPHLRHFDHHVLSYKVGALKPEEAIYREALSHAQAEPHECFFTDDIAEYVEGARRLGIDAVQFQSHEQVVGELRSRGVRV
ncbi:MAG: HAD family phosphatase [Bryobacterales bacterium]|nr:HAD family phosphatase [Bryobacterales bacterium]